MRDRQPKLVDVLPALARELCESLLSEGESELAAQVHQARVHALCACGNSDCTGVFLGPERGPCVGHYRAVLTAAVVSLGVCRGRLEWIDDRDLTGALANATRRVEWEALRPYVAARMP
jgi:hypothetical protein